MQVRLATGTFLYDDATSLLEVYISLGARSLTYAQQPDGSFLAHVPVRVQVQPARSAAPNAPEREPINDAKLDLKYSVADPQALTDGQVFVEQVRLAIPPGEYEILTTIYGPEGGDWREFDVVSDVTVPAYASKPETAISDIQLATRIQRPDSADGRFVKNGIQVVPNPDAFYGGALSSVPFYAEIYRPAGASDSFTLLSYVSESNQPVPLAGTQRRRARDPRQVDVIVDNVDISTLPSGAYFLRLVALNAANESIAEQSRRFFVINPNVVRAEAAVAELEYEEMIYAVMGEEELDQNVAHSKILANSREQGRLSQLVSDEDKRAYLVSFWRNRRTDRSGMQNDARRVFYERINASNSQFAQGGREGFETDRGRVFVKYGPPTETDRKSVNQGELPYEIWYYDNIPGEGRSQFVFADRFRIGRLELLHSDVTGEISLPNWQETISDR